MPWENRTAMNEKIAFIKEVEEGNYTFSSLCEYYKISRQTGYKLLNRYRQEGWSAFEEKSRRPHHSPMQTSDLILKKIRYWRRGGKPKAKNLKWGAKKIHTKLIEEFGEELVPSITTIHNVLVREGLVTPQRRRPKVESQNPRYESKCSNDIWSIDYKGWFKLGNGKRCYPLTVSDSHTRCLLQAKGSYRESWQGAQKDLRALFRNFGQPLYLLSDNGSPFASIQSPQGYGSLSYWLIDHGIRPLFSDPGRPDQNGRHERMHRELKSMCCPASKDLRSQNRRHNEFVRYYNEVRPHEALNMRTPSSLYESSSRPYVESVKSPEYGEDLLVRKVSKSGFIRWGSHEYLVISRGLAGKYVGLKKIGERLYEAYYREVCLGFFKEGEGIIKGQYYRLTSSRDLPERFRDRRARSRKKK